MISYGKSEPKFKDGWGDAIKELREACGLSLQDLADELNVTKGTISRWEHEMMIPNVIVAFKLADILGVDAASIFRI